MSWKIKQRDDGKWEYECFQSSWGLIYGEADSLNQAKVKLAIAEAELTESPYPPTVVKTMLKDVDKYASDFPDPPNT